MTPILSLVAAAAVSGLCAGPAPVSDAAFSASLREARLLVPAYASASSEEDLLLERTKDRDAGVRRAAVRGLKGYSQTSPKARERLRDIVRAGGEDFAVRYEAVKSLSPAATVDTDIRGFLRDIAKGRREGELQTIACKALYWEAGYDEDTRDALRAVARGAGSARYGALWGLFASTQHSEVRELLLSIAKRDGDVSARVEAAKSLFGAMHEDEVRRLARDLAKDSSETSALRQTGILMLVNRIDESDTRLLEDIAKSDADPLARAAAVTALTDPWGDRVYRHFHLLRRDRRYPYVFIHDPLDDE